MSGIDFKLLQDLAPYSNAYGHTMSNYIYRYRTCAAYHAVLNTDLTRTLATYYERIMRSFLITKNISYSKSLIKADMEKTLEIKDIDKLSLPKVDDETREKIKKVEDDGYKFIRDLQENLRKEKKLKSSLEIRYEQLCNCWPDTKIIVALSKCLGKGQQRAKIIFGTTGFYAVLHNTEVRYREQFNIRFWRLDEDLDHASSNAYFDLEIADAKSMFPEILNADWVKHK